jgi:acyl carrier protein
MNYEEWVDQILKTLLNLEQIEVGIGVTNCDTWDSLAQISLVALLEDEFKVKIGYQDLPRLMSRAGIIAYLSEKK